MKILRLDSLSPGATLSALGRALSSHWAEYLMEGAELGIFMISACAFTSLFGFHGSPLYRVVASASLRRLLVGIAMGLTAIGIIYSPIGRRSGAHFNPAVTLTFFRLGKMESADAFFYIVAQASGALAGVFISAAVLPKALADPAVNYVVTAPGRPGVAMALVAEVVISFGVMITVLHCTNSQRFHRLTGVCVGVLLATFIWLESPLSGTSLNPARTLGSAIPADYYRAIWIYFTAPLAGMLGAAEAYLRYGDPRVKSAKLMHDHRKRCIFKCGHSHGDYSQPNDRRAGSLNDLNPDPPAHD